MQVRLMRRACTHPFNLLLARRSTQISLPGTSFHRVGGILRSQPLPWSCLAAARQDHYPYLGISPCHQHGTSQGRALAYGGTLQHDVRQAARSERSASRSDDQCPFIPRYPLCRPSKRILSWGIIPRSAASWRAGVPVPCSPWPPPSTALRM